MCFALAVLTLSACQGVNSYNRNDVHTEFHPPMEAVLRHKSGEELEDAHVHALTHVGTKGNWLERIDFLTPFALVPTLLIDLGRLTVLEDADSLFDGLDFDNYLVFGTPDQDSESGGSTANTLEAETGPGGSNEKLPGQPISRTEVFEIVLQHLAIDNFVHGRLRDSFGGNGGEISFQASMHALTDRGQLLADDRQFLVTEEALRRSPLLIALQATEDGKELVDSINGKAEELVASIGKIEAYKSEVVTFANTALDDEKWKELLNNALAKLEESAQERLKEGVSQASSVPLIRELLAQEGNEQLLQRFRELFTAFFDTKVEETALQLAAILDEQLENQADQLLETANQLFRQAAHRLRDEVLTSSSAQHLQNQLLRAVDSLNLLLQYFQKYGVDDQGLYEKVEIIKGLADADRLMHLDFEGVRPTVLTPSFSNTLQGTADIVFCSNNKETKACRAPETLHVMKPGVLFRGTLDELSSLGQAQGFSLSVLMLERDGDQLAQALRYVQQYANDRELEIGNSGVEAAVLAEAFAVVAEKIAEDDVELKCMDIRFMAGDVRSGATPGTELYRLRECDLVVARNLTGTVDGGFEFGAVAVLSIRKVAD
jgi:hypothetical protein